MINLSGFSRPFCRLLDIPAYVSIQEGFEVCYSYRGVEFASVTVRCLGDGSADGNINVYKHFWFILDFSSLSWLDMI